MTPPLRRFFRTPSFAVAMHGAPAPEPVEEPAHAEAPPTVATPPTGGEWTIGIVFVLAALALVAWIGWTIAML